MMSFSVSTTRLELYIPQIDTHLLPLLSLSLPSGRLSEQAHLDFANDFLVILGLVVSTVLVFLLIFGLGTDLKRRSQDDTLHSSTGPFFRCFACGSLALMLGAG
uniref:Uncharacterized protein n=1 Tax=Favella ehrenbergii TaxID=182087 RepID=A0A7S3MN00_9SPIT|mmetsp:Transcript_27160/g.33776  ORF Transcript_27160/g.33776 Transcript_27160/m.33776 type:complete len:104 (+) Transcript_27160:555-866(+)